MKKTIFAILTLLLVLCVSGCNNANNDTNNENKADKKTQANVKTDTVVVPNVVGMDKDKAVKLLDEMGLEVELKYKHCVTEKDDSFAFLPDKSVLEQEPLQDVMIKRGGKITIVTQTLTDRFATSENDDGTVTLIERKSTVNFSNGICTIPNVYEDKKVTKINANVVNTINPWRDFPSDKLLPIETVKIPKDVEIIGEIKTNFKIVYY